MPRFRLPRLRFVLAAVVSAIGACDSASVFGPIVEGDIAEQRAIWTARSIEDYDLSLTYFNMWVSPMKSVVEVRGGEVVGCRNPETGVPRDPDDTWACPSMDDLFDDAEGRLASSDDWTVTLRYDEKLGLIRSMYADVPGWADEEYGYNITFFLKR